MGQTKRPLYKHPVSYTRERQMLSEIILQQVKWNISPFHSMFFQILATWSLETSQLEG